jgi:hypothetical protein
MRLGFPLRPRCWIDRGAAPIRRSDLTFIPWFECPWFHGPAVGDRRVFVRFREVAAARRLTCDAYLLEPTLTN